MRIPAQYCFIIRISAVVAHESVDCIRAFKQLVQLRQRVRHKTVRGFNEQINGLHVRNNVLYISMISYRTLQNNKVKCPNSSFFGTWIHDGDFLIFCLTLYAVSINNVPR